MGRGETYSSCVYPGKLTAGPSWKLNGALWGDVSRIVGLAGRELTISMFSFGEGVGWYLDLTDSTYCLRIHWSSVKHMVNVELVEN